MLWRCLKESSTELSAIPHQRLSKYRDQYFGISRGVPEICYWERLNVSEQTDTVEYLCFIWYKWYKVLFRWICFWLWQTSQTFLYFKKLNVFKLYYCTKFWINQIRCGSDKLFKYFKLIHYVVMFKLKGILKT